MSLQEPHAQWREQSIFTDEQQQVFNQVLFAVLLIAFGVIIGFLLFQDDKGYPTNLYSELLSIATTVLLLDFLARRREESRQREQRKHDLIARMGSIVNDVAVPAVEELRRNGWLRDGSLRKARLISANLQRANLVIAELPEADLGVANFQHANLNGANLQNSNLDFAKFPDALMQGVKLQGATLISANLQEAHMINANLAYSNLTAAKLQGANLRDALLVAANFNKAEFNETTKLPDGTMWTPETDLGRFVDPTHPLFWRSNDPTSPAYKENQLS